RGRGAVGAEANPEGGKTGVIVTWLQPPGHALWQAEGQVPECSGRVVVTQPQHRADYTFFSGEEHQFLGRCGEVELTKEPALCGRQAVKKGGKPGGTHSI